MIFVNFKTYPEASGDNAVKLTLACELAHEDTGVPITPVVSIADLWRVTQHTEIPVWTQHVDPTEPGAHTGFTPIESVIGSGIHGTILNHSEHPLTFEVLKQTVERIRSVDSEFPIMICVPDMEKLAHAIKLRPKYIAYEPPELIGSSTASVATEKGDIISTGVQAAGDIPLIVGAGIKDANDVKGSIERGAKGVLVASAVVKAGVPKEVITNLARAFSDS